MKLIYILGLEHSGTTLIDHLLSGAEGVVGLGEVANYFSVEHMRQYHSRWGEFPEAYQCSCDSAQEDCPLWSELSQYSGNGVEQHAPISEKYSALSDVIVSQFGDQTIMVDSSKSIRGFQNWLSCLPELSLDKKDIHLILAIKDARSFVASMIRKNSGKQSLKTLIQHFNYWLGANQHLAAFANDSGYEFRVSLYEQFCHQTDATLLALANDFIDQEKLSLKLNHRNSHILIGNKSFILRNRQVIKYDDSWQSYRLLKSVYALHWRVKQFNEQNYAQVDFSINQI